MSEVTVRSLAKVLNMPPEKLLEQLTDAGMDFTKPDQVISSTEKMKLLGFLRRTHGKEAPPAAEAAPKKITLKRRKVEEITVGGGRGKSTVAVEVRQKRTYVKRTEVDQPVNNEREEAQRKLAESQARNVEEQEALLAADTQRQAEEKQRAEAERLAAEAEAAAAAEAARIAEEEAKADRVEKNIPGKLRDAAAAPRGDKPARAKPSRGRGRGGDDDSNRNRFAGEMHLSADERARRGSRSKKGRSRAPEQSRTASGQHGFSKPTTPMQREIAIGETITVSDLAQKLALKGGEVVKALFKMGVMATITQTIDHDTAALVVEELGHIAVRAGEADDAELALIAHQEANIGEKDSRPPIVTIMGHVDHGKTSLLDHIRRAKVASGEAGGITQHIGAYHVETDRGIISFLDTPGHAAFTSMRQRGAKLTDIVVLVVAADDGVKPQTKEAIKHAKAAKVPLIVAINKMDKADANPDRVKQDLLAEEIVAEEYGGDTQMVPISAKTGMGIDDLLDAILLQAEVLELKAITDGRAQGVVIESSLDRGRGPVATVLVQSGTLNKGDYLVCGVEYGRVRALFDENGKQVESASPSIPVVVLGLSGVPMSGDDFVVVEDERLAKDVAQQRETKQREAKLVKTSSRMEDLMAQMGQGGDQQTLNLLIKADVHGSVEALCDSLTALSNEYLRINVIASGVGGITESEAQMAATSKATVIGFNVRADAAARKVIETHGLDLRYFSIIYDVIDQVKQVASGLMSKEIREEILGLAEVRDVFRSSKYGAVAGSFVVEGTVKRNKPIRVLRDNTVIFEGELESLRRFKEIVDEVKFGTECGIAVKQYNDVKPGDQIECFERIEVARTL